MKYDLAVFIGRFQPFHNGHLSVIRAGLEDATRVLVFTGSAGCSRSHRNPFTNDERSQMILDSLDLDEISRVTVRPLEDSPYNDVEWLKSVQQGVANEIERFNFKSDYTPKIVLIGHNKDSSSFYLNMFPQWGGIEAPNYMGFSSTQIRNVFFSNIGEMWLKNADGHKIGDLDREKIITTKTKEFLTKFLEKDEYKQICKEYDYVLNYRASMEVGKPIQYPIIMTTVDAIVVQSGHVLLIRRRSEPGKGLWALPGGFLNPEEFIVTGMLRELREETGLKVPEPVLRGNIFAQAVFDDPRRSSRGRVITHAVGIKLPDEDKFPKVKGMDDADKAKFVAISELQRKNLFEDHYDIIQNMIARIKPNA